jgi:hypothetical protein
MSAVALMSRFHFRTLDLFPKYISVASVRSRSSVEPKFGNGLQRNVGNANKHCNELPKSLLRGISPKNIETDEADNAVCVSNWN